MDSDDLDAVQAERAAAEAGSIGGEAGRPAGEDPAEAPVREAGGGEAEGFEEAENALIDHAEHGDLGHSPRLDALAPEAEADRSDAAYGDADDVASSAREEVREDAAPGGDAA